MTEHTEQARKESERRIRAHTANAAPYPHKGQFAQGAREVLADEAIDYAPRKPDGKGPVGWRRSIVDGETLSHGKGGWLATLRSDGPGSVLASMVRYCPTREWAKKLIPEGWSGMTMKASDGRGNYRLTMSRVFDDADEAMAACDEVMG